PPTRWAARTPEPQRTPGRGGEGRLPISDLIEDMAGDRWRLSNSAEIACGWAASMGLLAAARPVTLNHHDRKQYVHWGIHVQASHRPATARRQRQWRHELVPGYLGTRIRRLRGHRHRQDR